jgi:hypothetical protein
MMRGAASDTMDSVLLFFFLFLFSGCFCLPTHRTLRLQFDGRGRLVPTQRHAAWYAFLAANLQDECRRVRKSHQDAPAAEILAKVSCTLLNEFECTFSAKSMSADNEDWL